MPVALSGNESLELITPCTVIRSRTYSRVQRNLLILGIHPQTVLSLGIFAPPPLLSHHRQVIDAAQTSSVPLTWFAQSSPQGKRGFFIEINEMAEAASPIAAHAPGTRPAAS